MRNQQGFTLIELMIVIAILGILMAIAIPAYQDYTVRAKVSEGIYAAAPAKLAVSETFLSEGTLPTTNTAAGYSGFNSSYVDSVIIGASGAITININHTAVGANSDVTVHLTPSTASDKVAWNCTASGATNYSPASCRN